MKKWPKGMKTGAFLLVILAAACSSLPKIEHKKYSFPKEAMIGTPTPDKLYDVLGSVRSKVDFPTLDPDHDENALCSNYFNKSVRELLKFAKEKGGDAVIEVRSVVFLMDGKMETHPRPECSDEGDEGQVLTRGIAIRWKPTPTPIGD